jgi:hypothetical protein
MFDHHRQALEIVVAKLSADPHVEAVLLAGSIAHGYAQAASDVDLMIVVNDEDFERRQAGGDMLYFERESCSYDGGYIDGKYMNRDFIRLVAERGSEPARFAFKDARVVFARREGIVDLVAAAATYPDEGRDERIKSFWSQVCAWRWYHQEGTRHENEYLIQFSAANFVLFVGRLMLARNRALYPYHKWLMRTLEGVADKPDALMELIDAVLRQRDTQSIDRLYEAVRAMGPWGIEDWEWSKYFVRDTEQTWVRQDPAIADA